MNKSVDMLNLPNLIEQVPAVVLRLAHARKNWRTLFITQNVTQWGYCAEDFSAGIHTWFDIVHPSDRALVAKSLNSYETQFGHQFKSSYRVVDKSGKSIPVTDYCTVQRDKQGKIICYDITVIPTELQDDSDRLAGDCYRQQIVLGDIISALKDAGQQNVLELILERAGGYLNCSRAILLRENITYDSCLVMHEWCNGGITSCFKQGDKVAYLSDMGDVVSLLRDSGRVSFDFDKLPQKCLEEFASRNITAYAIFAVQLEGKRYGFLSFEDCLIQRKWDDSTMRFLANIAGLVSVAIARQSDFALQQHYAAEIDRRTYFDNLTGLANRFQCESDLLACMQQVKKNKLNGYLLMLDLDDFSVINDCNGHSQGDAVLVSVANWLKENFAEPNKIFRFAGNGFIVLIPPCEGYDIQSTVDSLLERAQQPWNGLREKFFCTLSIGVVEYNSKSGKPLELIRQADIALRTAKQNGKNKCEFYHKSFGLQALQRSKIEAVLRKAMENNYEGFSLLFQPYINQPEGQIRGAEALLRISSEGEMLLPRTFLPLANYLGLIVHIGKYALREAARQCRAVLDFGQQDFVMTVNISAEQLQQHDIAQYILQMLAEEQVPCANFAVAISAGDAMTMPDVTARFCRTLRRKGVQLVLDNFGAGRSGFIFLHDLPVDLVKLSPMLMQRLDDSFVKEYIDLVIRVCHSLGKKVCISGIETAHQFDFSKASRADELQGFYLYRVEGAEQLAKLFDLA